jgi:hypothetical protein
MNSLLRRTFNGVIRRGINTEAVLIQNTKSRWPATAVISSEKVLPPRTVPDSALKFKLSSTFDHGTGIYFPHMNMNPEDFKVSMMASVDELGLSESELRVFIEMVGPRFNTGSRTVKLTSDRFPNRIENKRYLIVLLEKLIAEAKSLDTLPDKHV